MIIHRQFLPASQLREHVMCYEAITNSDVARPASVQRVTPDGCLELNFSLGTPLLRSDANGVHLLHDAYVVYRLSRSYFVQRTGPARVMSVRFRPWGAHRFTNVPMHLLADRVLEAVDLFGSEVTRLQQRLANTLDQAEVIRLIDHFLLERYRKAQGSDPLVMDAAHTLHAARGSKGVRALHGRYGLSARRLQQRFKERMGMAPMAFVRLLRFQDALRGLHHGSSSLDVAFGGGYCDQPHFVREFKAFAGISPYRYVKEAHPLNDAMLLGAITAT
jgi:AraC-like DNA-binding protein